MTKKQSIRITMVICSLFIISSFFPSVHGYLNNPNDEYLMQQWGWLNIYADVAYSNNYRGNSSTIVAVIDTGIDLDHPDLQANIFTNPNEIPGNGVDDDHNGYPDDIHGWNFVSNDSNTDDNDGHGTHVAGIIAAISNCIGICGVAPNIKILPIKVIEQENGSTALLHKAILYACSMKAKVISMSLGSNDNDTDTYKASETAYHDYNITLVAAAGNSGSGVVHYPAAYEHVIAVAATTKSNEHAFYSNYGPQIDIAAPGGDSSGLIISTFLNGTYEEKAGTSMATPFVSGAIALMLQWNHTLTPDQVRARLNETAIDLGDLGYDYYFGAGLVNVAGILGLPMVHTYNPILDWFIRNIWWIGLIGIAVVILIIYMALRKKPKPYSSSTNTINSSGFY